MKNIICNQNGHGSLGKGGVILLSIIAAPIVIGCKIKDVCRKAKKKLSRKKCKRCGNVYDWHEHSRQAFCIPKNEYQHLNHSCSSFKKRK